MRGEEVVRGIGDGGWGMRSWGGCDVRARDD